MTDRPDHEPSEVETHALDLWLIRHAESLGNLDGTQADTDLSARGFEQASALGRALASRRFDATWSSPLIRARRTLELALPDSAPRVDARLSEFVPPPGPRVVDLSGLSVAELRELLSVPAAASSESGSEFQRRIKDWLAVLPSAGRHVVVTHFTVIREIIGSKLGYRHAPQEIAHTSIFRLSIDSQGTTTTSTLGVSGRHEWSG